MKGDMHRGGSQDFIDAAAAQWVLRQDRGLSASEQDELSAWIATDPRHGPALGASRWGWEELDRLAGIQSSVQAVPDPDLLRAKPRAWPSRARVVAFSLGLAAAAVVVAAFTASERAGRPKDARERALAFSWLNLSAPCERRALDDGSVIELNRGSEVTVAFTATERRVELVRGEAHFTVAKNPARPFIVTAHGVEARAVGTAFNVKVDPAAIEVLVTEGRVRVDPAPTEEITPGAPARAPVVEVGQRAVVALKAGSRPQATVATLTAAEVEAQLAWQPRMLDFNDRPLGQIVEAFNRHNDIRLVLADPALDTLKLSAAIRSDNVAGFVRLLEADFGVRAEWRGDNRIYLKVK